MFNLKIFLIFGWKQRLLNTVFYFSQLNSKFLLTASQSYILVKSSFNCFSITRTFSWWTTRYIAWKQSWFGSYITCHGHNSKGTVTWILILVKLHSRPHIIVWESFLNEQQTFGLVETTLITIYLSQERRLLIILL